MRTRALLATAPARWVSFACIILIACGSSGCGGGSSSSSPIQPPPPPPSPDFALSISPSSTTISQGATSSALQVSVQALQGFSGDVQITLNGIPVGITSFPQSPFTVASGGTATLLIGASQIAATGSASITMQATSGKLSHAANLALTIQAGTTTASRTTYASTDSQSAFDDPSGEPHHRHIVYDPANRHLFVDNRARNRVEIFSTLDGSQIGSVNIAGAASADLSPDARTVWVGTTTEQIAAIDTATLQRNNTFQLAGIVPIPNTIFDRPEEVIPLPSGKLLVRLRQANAAEALLALWDPANNSLSDLTSAAPQVFQSGVGVLARSGDHSRVLVASNDATGSAVLLDGAASLLTGIKTIGSGNVQFAAGNADGTQFAAVLGAGASEQVVLLDASLNVLATQPAMFARGLVFSRDGQSIYVAQNQNGNPLLSVLARTDLHSLKTVADIVIQTVSTEVEESDETNFVFGLSNRGIAFLDASESMASNVPVPVFASAPSVAPASGSNLGSASVTLSGQNFGANPAVHFGTQNALVTSSSSAQVQTISPASTASGAVNVTAYFPNGAISLAPDAFSYGTQILQVLPNTANSSGGDTVAIYGYGFGDDLSKISVKFGSAAATIQKLENVQSLSSSLGLDATYPFPLQRLTVIAPAGSPGSIDIALLFAVTSATAKHSFQFLQASQVFAKPGFYKFLLYDQKRQLIYLSNIDHLDVFDLNAGVYRSGILPPGGPPPNSLIRQAALSPDASQLLVADFGAQSIYLIQPDTTAGNIVKIGGIQGDVNSGPVRVAATSAQTAFVGLASYDSGSSGCGTCLQQMDLTASPVSVGTAPQPQVSALTSAPLAESSANGDAAFFSFAIAPGQPMAGWHVAAPGRIPYGANKYSVNRYCDGTGRNFIRHTKFQRYRNSRSESASHVAYRGGRN